MPSNHLSITNAFTAYDVINKATLKLYGNNNSTDTSASIPVQVYGILGNWSESSLTFNNAPLPTSGNEATSEYSTLPFSELRLIRHTVFYSFVTTQPIWVEFDVTPWVRWQLPQGNGVVSFALDSFISGYAEFSSKEGPHPPQLSVVSVAATTTPVTAPQMNTPTTTNQPTANQPTTTQPVTTTTPSSQTPSPNNIQNSTAKNVVGLVVLAVSLIFAY